MNNAEWYVIIGALAWILVEVRYLGKKIDKLTEQMEKRNGQLPLQ